MSQPIQPRKFDPVDDELLKILWPSVLTDKELESRLGRHRGTIHWRARRIGLPGRRFARSQMAKRDLVQ